MITYVKEEEYDIETTDLMVRRFMEQQKIRVIAQASRVYDKNEGPMKQAVQKLTGPNKFKCELCDYVGQSNAKLTRHMGRHSGEKPFSCNACGYSTNRNDSLKRHMINKHGGFV